MSPAQLLNEIRFLVEDGHYTVGHHVFSHMAEKGFEKEGIVGAVMGGRPLEIYAGQRRYLIAGRSGCRLETNAPCTSCVNWRRTPNRLRTQCRPGGPLCDRIHSTPARMDFSTRAGVNAMSLGCSVRRVRCRRTNRAPAPRSTTSPAPCGRRGRVQ